MTPQKVVPEFSTKPHAREHTVALAALAIAILGWVVFPTFWPRLFAFAIAEALLAFIWERSQWSSTMSPTKRHAVTAMIVSAVSVIALFQLPHQWKADHATAKEKASQVCWNYLRFSKSSISENYVGIHNTNPHTCFIFEDGTILSGNGIAVENDTGQ